MRCIFCDEKRPGSREHVFPLAIGGTLEIDRVCTPCNSELGGRVDAALTNDFIVRNIRAQLKLAGNSRATPETYELLLGVGDLADGTGRIKATFNENTRKIDLFRLPNTVDTVAADGTTTRRITMDERDLDKVPRVIARERRQLGLPPLTVDEMAAVVQECRDSVTSVVNPKVNLKRSFDFSFVRHALLKIAYELAFIWLGESYLDDSLAKELRAAIMANDPASTDHLHASGCIRDGVSDIFRFWADDTTSHLAYLGHVDGGMYVALRVFDAYATLVKVSADASRYLSGTFDPSRIRFIAIDPVNRLTRESSLVEEVGRIVAERNKVVMGLLSSAASEAKTSGPASVDFPGPTF